MCKILWSCQWIFFLPYCLLVYNKRKCSHTFYKVFITHLLLVRNYNVSILCEAKYPKYFTGKFCIFSRENVKITQLNCLSLYKRDLFAPRELTKKLLNICKLCWSWAGFLWVWPLSDRWRRKKVIFFFGKKIEFRV